MANGQTSFIGGVINTGENRRGGGGGRSRKNMRSANVADISQRRMDHISWV
jgi:hypothetical protein